MQTLNDYKMLTQQAIALIEYETNLVANLANLSALLNTNLENINWVGFYLLQDDQLVLGPFQGKVACTRIALDRGVCGKAFSSNRIQRIDNVHDFADHIACDTASESEIVLPININGEVVAVLDIDSPIRHRFNEIDEQGLAYLVEKIAPQLNYNKCI